MSAFLFPGQGSQAAGMGKDFYEHSPAARAVFDAAEALAPGLLQTTFAGPAETLNDTRNAQPALLACTVAIAQCLIDRGHRPTACCGHSLGEIPALVVAGVCSFEDALAFTQVRAQLMSTDVPQGGMAAVLGLDPAAIEAALPEGAHIANYNGPAQTVISGTAEALAAAAESLKAAGAKRVVPLTVSGPFHSPYMRPASIEFAETLAEVTFYPPSIPFVSSVRGEVVSDPDSIRRLLAEQLASPVRWTQAMQALGPGPAIECGPGGVLRGLCKRIEDAPSVSPAGTWAEAESLAAAQ